MNTLQAPAEQQFLLHDVDWEFYDSLLRRLGDRPVYVTYDRGSLELMSPSPRHESSGELVGRLILVLTEELNIPILSGGSTTFRRKDLDRGLEPDKCYWIQNETRVRGLDQVDLTRDPPPDLAVEIEVSRRLLDRIGIYAALGVPELWRYDGERLQVFQLAADGAYHLCDRSPSLPMVRIRDLDHFLAMRGKKDETALVRGFRDWVRLNVAHP